MNTRYLTSHWPARWLSVCILLGVLVVGEADELHIAGELTVSSNLTVGAISIPASSYLPSEVFPDGNELRIKGPTRTSPGGVSGALILSGGDGGGGGSIAQGPVRLHGSVIEAATTLRMTPTNSIEIQGGVIRGADHVGAPSSQRTLVVRGGSGNAGGAGHVILRPGSSPSMGHILLDGAVIVSNTVSVASDLHVAGGITGSHAVFGDGTSGHVAITNGAIQGSVSIQLGDLDLVSHGGDTNFLYVVNGTSTGRVAIVWD